MGRKIPWGRPMGAISLGAGIITSRLGLSPWLSLISLASLLDTRPQLATHLTCCRRDLFFICGAVLTTGRSLIISTRPLAHLFGMLGGSFGLQRHLQVLRSVCVEFSGAFDVGTSVWLPASVFS